MTLLKTFLTHDLVVQKEIVPNPNILIQKFFIHITQTRPTDLWSNTLKRLLHVHHLSFVLVLTEGFIVITEMGCLSKLQTLYLLPRPLKAQELKTLLRWLIDIFRSVNSKKGGTFNPVLLWNKLWIKAGRLIIRVSLMATAEIDTPSPSITYVCECGGLFAIRKPTCFHQRFRVVDLVRKLFDWSGTTRCKCWKYHCCEWYDECIISLCFSFICCFFWLFIFYSLSWVKLFPMVKWFKDFQLTVNTGFFYCSLNLTKLFLL